MTIGGRGKFVWGKSFAFSSKVVAGVGSVGLWRVGALSHFRGLVYSMAVMSSFLCPLARKVFQWSALPALMLRKYLILLALYGFHSGVDWSICMIIGLCTCVFFCL